MKTQKELIEEIIAETGINIVTCGSCGDVFLHELEQTEITCPHCDFKSEPCHFPDFIY